MPIQRMLLFLLLLVLMARDGCFRRRFWLESKAVVADSSFMVRFVDGWRWAFLPETTFMVVGIRMRHINHKNMPLAQQATRLQNRTIVLSHNPRVARFHCQ